MSSETYNGWPNKETWSVHMHITNHEEAQSDAERFAKNVKRNAEDIPQVKNGTWSAEEGPRFLMTDWLKDWIETETERQCQGFGELLALELVTDALARVDWNTLAIMFLED